MVPSKDLREVLGKLSRKHELSELQVQALAVWFWSNGSEMIRELLEQRSKAAA